MYGQSDRIVVRPNVLVVPHLEGKYMHFVVIAGKEGFDYLIRDPGAGGAKGLYPLRDLDSKIEALRYYEKVGNVTGGK